MTVAASDRAGAHELLELSATLDGDDERRDDKEIGELPIYAIDSNVAIFLSQPSAHAASAVRAGIQRVGFGTVLEGDPDELTDIVAHALAEHLYVHLRKNAPLLLIPPVAAEVHRHVLRLAQQHESPSESVLRAWRDAGTKLLAKLDHTKQFGERAEQLIGEMQKHLFLRYGPAAALGRLRRVFAEKAILSSDVASRLMDEQVGAVLDAADAIRNTIPLTVRANDFMKAGLNRENPDDFSDAFVMARLERANQMLERVRSRHRIIYVTADRNLLAVIGDGNMSLRLRHPRAWLTRLSIFQSDEESGRRPLLELLRFKAQAADRPDEEARAAIQKEWHDYLGRATESFVPLLETREMFFNQARDMLDRYSSNIERFHEEISDLQEIAYENCFVVATETAAGEAQRSKSYYARTVPPLVFEQWPVTQQTVETFLSWHAPVDFDVNIYRDGLRAIDAEDPSRYARYLALGTIFAGRGQWTEAASLAAKANSFALPDGSDPGGANGREGYFFEAVARRHRARSAEDLDDALVLLERARAIADREEQTHAQSPAGEEIFDVVPERFEAERLASETSRFYFDRYAKDRSVAVDDRTTADRLVQQFGNLLERLRARLVTRPEQLSPAASRALRQLIARTVTNILGLALIGRVDGDAVDRAWTEAEKIGLTDQRLDDLSSIVAITILAFKRLAGRGRSSRDADLLRRHLAQYQHYYVFPYDEARFAEIARAASAR